MHQFLPVAIETTADEKRRAWVRSRSMWLWIEDAWKMVSMLRGNIDIDTRERQQGIGFPEILSPEVKRFVAASVALVAAEECHDPAIYHACLEESKQRRSGPELSLCCLIVSL